MLVYVKLYKFDCYYSNQVNIHNYYSHANHIKREGEKEDLRKIKKIKIDKDIILINTA